MDVSERDPTEVYVDIGGGTIQMGRMQKENFTFVEEEDSNFVMTSATCRIEPWNKVHLDRIPSPELHNYWVRNNISRRNHLYHTTPSPLAAFVHPEHITVTLTAENKFGKKVYCRYFDCKRKELSQSFECSQNRRFIVEEESEQSPLHYFTVCMSTLYEEEPKFIQIVDFIEHHKLQGATFLYIYLRNVSSYDRMLLDDYVRTGEIEVIVMNDHYWREYYMWQKAQTNDCHMRNVNFAKWTAILDIDERIVMKKDWRIVDYLDKITNPNVVNLQFKVQLVLKDSRSPARYENDKQFFEELVFRKFHNTSEVLQASKSIIRPESIAAMNINAPVAVYKGLKKTYVSDKVAVVRKYKNVEGVALDSNKNIVGPYSMTDIEPHFKFKLTAECLGRVKQVYDTIGYSCDLMERISNELSESDEPDDFLDPDADRFAECPIDDWNAVETNKVPFNDFEVIQKWSKQRVTPKFHPIIQNALLFDDYLMVVIDTKQMSGRHVFCRYFDCLRREIPSQFESKIYPESVVYCPRRIGVHYISISGNVLEKPPRPIAIRNSTVTESPESFQNTENETQIGVSKVLIDE